MGKTCRHCGSTFVFGSKPETGGEEIDFCPDCMKGRLVSTEETHRMNETTPRKSTSVEMICPICGETYTAKNRNKRYCSQRCRQVAYRIHSKTYEAFEGMENAPSPVATVDAMNAISSAVHVANEFSRLSRTAPYQLRPACSRIADAVFGALGKEGFL